MAGNSDWIPGVQPEGSGRPKAEFAKTNASPSPIAVEWRKQELLRLIVEGYSIKQGALILGCAYATAMNYAREEAFRTQLRGLRSNALEELDKELIQTLRTKAEMIDDLAFLAIDEMKKLLQDSGTHVGVKAKMIDSVLDRCPEVSRTKKVDITAKTITMKAEDLLAAAQAAMEVEQGRVAKEELEARSAESEQDVVRD